MFQTLLSNLQTLISSRFLVSSFFPTLAFWFANAVTLFFLNGRFQEYVLSNIGQIAGLTAVVTAAALIGVGISAYAASALLPTIHSMMEGNWPSWLAGLFVPSQMYGYERLEQKVRENNRLRGQLQAQWQPRLLDARKAGSEMAANNYTRRAASASEVERLAALRRRAQVIPGSAIDSAVKSLASDLRVHDANRPGPDDDFALDNTQQQLESLIRYAENFAVAQSRLLVTKSRFSFGDLPLAPTRMGNVARTVQSYAVSRYNLNFELFWSRLQLPAQKDKDFGPLLQAAKTQIDFLVTCSALTLFWTFIWIMSIYVTRGPGLAFLIVGLLGPFVAYLWYRVAVAQYRSLADLLRSSVDLFRFDLLAALRYPQPDGVAAERDLWDKVDALHLLYQLDDLPYVHPKS
jgi:hypothetical protein